MAQANASQCSIATLQIEYGTMDPQSVSRDSRKTLNRSNHLSISPSLEQASE